MCDVLNLKHECRTTMQEEVNETIKYKCENKQQGIKYLEHIKNYVSKFDLPDTCIIIRKNNLETNNAFEYCLEMMKIYGLKRDQNIYNYALDNKNITPILLNYENLDFL